MTYCDRAVRIAIPFLTVAALLAIGVRTPAMAASPAACDVSGIVARSLPAIVNITVVKVITGNGEEDGPGVDADTKAPVSNGTAASASTQSTGPHFETFVGSGSIINSAGIIITNKHVIRDAAVIKVTFHNRTAVPAQLIAA